jgi:sugar-specific transcriptional regulator TrmB
MVTVNANIREALNWLGLTDNEIQIYLAFLDSGEKTAAEIARKIKLDKSSTYRAVDSLNRKGLLIINPRSKGTTFEASNLEVLNDLVMQKKHEISLQEKSISNFVQNLKAKTPGQRNTYITIEKGIDSLLKAMDESLNSQEKLIREKFKLDEKIFQDERYSHYVNNYYVYERIKRGINIREMDKIVDEHPFKEIMRTDETLLKEVRVLPKSLQDDNSFRIYDDTILIISYDESGDFIAVKIRDKFVAGLLKNMFDYIWETCEIY